MKGGDGSHRRRNRRNAVEPHSFEMPNGLARGKEYAQKTKLFDGEFDSLGKYPTQEPLPLLHGGGEEGLRVKHHQAGVHAGSHDRIERVRGQECVERLARQ